MSHFKLNALMKALAACSFCICVAGAGPSHRGLSKDSAKPSDSEKKPSVNPDKAKTPAGETLDKKAAPLPGPVAAPEQPKDDSDTNDDNANCEDCVVA